MPFVKCSVDGCSTKLQPIQKLDPRDRETWMYRECDICFRPACEKHSIEIDGRIICDRCRRELDAEQPPLIDLGTERLGDLVPQGEAVRENAMAERERMPLMPGDLVQAKVKQVAVFGIFLESLGHEILVLIPETSWIPCYASCTQIADVGDEFRVRIIGRVEHKNQYAGSFRAVYPESDPWSGMWELNVGEMVEAKVIRLVEHADRCGDKKGYLLELRPAAYVMLCAPQTSRFEKGQRCSVTVTAVDPDRRQVVVEFDR